MKSIILINDLQKKLERCQLELDQLKDQVLLETNVNREYALGTYTLQENLDSRPKNVIYNEILKQLGFTTEFDKNSRFQWNIFNDENKVIAFWKPSTFLLTIVLDENTRRGYLAPSFKMVAKILAKESLGKNNDVECSVV